MIIAPEGIETPAHAELQIRQGERRNSQKTPMKARIDNSGNRPKLEFVSTI
jgi:hypothetical protein